MVRAGLLPVALALIATLLPLETSAAELEPWAGGGLNVSDGLVIWLDAAAQNAARQHRGEAALTDGASLEYWLDSSGNGRHLRQADAAKRSTVRLDKEFAAVRFNGQGTFVALDGLNLSLEQATIFIVAAPLHNEGQFAGMLSAHATGIADYLSGINIDQGAFSSERFEVVNVEGPGFGGMQNLRTGSDEFLRFHRLCVISTTGPRGVALYVDGKAEGARDRKAPAMKMDALIVGGRYVGQVQGMRSFFAGEIAEVVIYDRVLNEAERTAVDGYLAAKYAKAGPVPAPADMPGYKRIERVASSPPVQMHVPGFTTRQLPVELSNINNVLYREDGVLVALAYDGHIYLLRDTDGDGLEDEAKLFWDKPEQLRAPIGMALTPPGYKLGRGVFVASKSKCSLILDADVDDRAEKEVIVAQGWNELPVNVDALGVAVDPCDQSIYFGLGTTDFTNAYQVPKEGKARYSLQDEHGTIQRVSPDFKSREIVATGIRFPVGIRFNAAGDLFCTDQEGATWLANGNPFDELLHVQQGRHYGFPPRHPRHLPDVVDEPSVFDYGPQHLSTCGLNFNEPATDGTTFGPEWWRSDAFVTSYSRAKVYRTKLVRTDSGYVAQTQVMATLNMLTADACVAPDRSMVVAVHSGGGDWGSGPAGQGKLYKVAYMDTSAAIPSLVWAQTPREVRIAFDRPVDPETLKDLVSRAAIDGGEFAAGAERFESKRPGYAVVEHQLRAPRFTVDVQSVQLSADRRTLILTTSPQSAAVNYALQLPGVAPAPNSDEEVTHGLPQLPDIDLQYDLCGVEASWEPANGSSASTWSGWLPHVNTDVSRALTQASAEHDSLWRAADQAGALTLRTSLNLRDMLRPAVQPGATIDYQWPPEEVTLTLESNAALEASLDGKPVAAAQEGNGKWTARLSTAAVRAEGEEPARHELEIRLERESTGEPLAISLHYHTQEDPRPRALALNRMLLPWTRPADRAAPVVDNRDLPELKGGNWLRGEKEFLGSQAACSKCHKMRGVGGTIGPDLSNLPQRDYASVLRDVVQPSYSINPDFVSQTVLLEEGRVLTGTVRTDGDQLIVADQEGKETVVDRDEVESFEHSAQSIMPEGIPKALGEERLRDLLTYLLVEPPHMPVYGEGAPPPPRHMAEVEAVLEGSAGPGAARLLHVVLVSGPKDHGLGEHDYPAWQKAWKPLLEMSDKVRVTTAFEWPSAEDFESADAMVFFQRGQWNADRARDVDAFLARGGGLSYIHWAVDGGENAADFAKRIGLAWYGGRSKFRHGPLDINFVKGSEHPIARNFGHVHFHDESYWQGTGDPQRINLLATGVEEGEARPLFWTMQHGEGRVFVSIPGHYSWTFDDPLFRLLLLRGLAWSAKEPVDRFNELIFPGARIRLKNEALPASRRD